MNLIKKLFVYAVVFMTAIAMVPVTPTVAATNFAAGDLLKATGSSAVYYYTGSELKAFPNSTVYFSWYPDFKSVKTITPSELASISFSGKFVTMRPGTKLVKIGLSPKVYAVEPGGKLRWIDSEATAKNLYGANWNKMISDVADAFWFWYDISTAESNKVTTTHPTATLVKYANSNDIYYIDGTSKRKVTDAGFTANKFDMDYVLTIPDTITYTDGTQITGAEDGLFPISVSNVTTPTTSLGALTVGMSSTNPASATIISNSANTAQALVPFLAVNLTASSAGDVKVTKMTFERTGISADTDFSNLYLYDGTGMKLTDGGSIASKMLTFNSASGIITIPAGTTKTVVLKGDLTIPTSASKQVGFNLTGVVSNAASTSGSYPVVGNLMTTAQATDLGYATIESTAIPTAATSVNSNEKDFEAFKVTLQANYQDMQLEGLRLTQVGSVSAGDLTNFKLTVGGTTLATSELNGNNELYFDLSSSPYVITKGNSKTFSLRVDIAKGSTRTFYFALQSACDLVMKDRSYNVYTQSFDSGTTWTAYKPSVSTYVYTISSGTLSTSKDTTSPSGTAVVNATHVKLGTFKFEATGEDVKIKSLDIAVSSTAATADSGLQNVQIYYDGAQVGQTKNITVSTTPVNFAFGSSFVLPAGTPKLVDIYADTKKANGTTLTDGGNIRIVIEGGTDAQGVVSLSTVTVGGVVGNSLTLSTSALSMAKNSAYGSNYITSPATQAKIGSFTITSGATQGITVDNIYVSGVTSGQASNLVLKNGTTEIGRKNALPSSGTTTIGIGSNLVLAAGANKIIDVYADITSGITSYTFTTVVAADGTTSVTNSAAVSSGATLQTMTIAAGSITEAAASSKPDFDIVIGGMTSLVNAVEFTALNEGMTITDIKVTKGLSANAEAIAGVILEYPTKTGTAVTPVLSLDGNGAAYFSGLTMYVPKNGTAVLSIKAVVSSLTSSATNISGYVVQLGLPTFAGNTDTSVFSAIGDSGTPVTASASGAMPGNAMYLRATRPTITLVSLPTTLLSDGTQVLAKFKIAADATNDVSWYRIVFSYVSSSGVSVTDSTINLYKEGSSTKLKTADISLTPATKIIDFVSTSEQTITKGTSQVYELKGDITGTAASRSFQTRIGGGATAIPATTPTTSIYADVATTESRFVWSDRSAVPHTAFTSSDWCDSNYVKSLPTDSQTLFTGAS